MTRMVRCCVCGRWVRADARVAHRQRTCLSARCKAALRVRTQAGWRGRNPGHALAWRARQRGEQSVREPVAPLRVPAPLDRLPWEAMQEEFGVQGTDYLAGLGRLLVVPAGGWTSPDAVKDEMRSHPGETTEGSRRLHPGVAKDEMTTQPLAITGEFPRLRGGP